MWLPPAWICSTITSESSRPTRWTRLSFNSWWTSTKGWKPRWSNKVKKVFSRHRIYLIKKKRKSAPRELLWPRRLAWIEKVLKSSNQSLLRSCVRNPHCLTTNRLKRISQVLNLKKSRLFVKSWRLMWSRTPAESIVSLSSPTTKKYTSAKLATSERVATRRVGRSQDFQDKKGL